MSIRGIFASDWEHVLEGACKFPDTDVLYYPRSVIINRNACGHVFAQLIVVFDEDGKPAVVTTRACTPALAIPLYLHFKEQKHRLKAAGIVGRIAFEKGLVTCTYYREDALPQLV